MAAELPDAIDLKPLADSGETVSGVVGATRLGRVSGEFRMAGEARASLGLSRDAEGRIRLVGTIEAALEARCQRCLEWMPLALKSRVDVLALGEGAAAPLDEDTVSAPGGRLALREFVEDEILLGCPMIPAHDTPACHAERDETESEDRHRPFAGLGEMIKQRR